MQSNSLGWFAGFMAGNVIGRAFARMFYFFTLTWLVFTHIRIGERRVSLRRVLVTAAFMFLPVVWLTFFSASGLVLLLYVGTIVLAIAQRFYTKHRKKLGDFQFSFSYGTPLIRYVKPDMSDGVAYRLSAAIFLAIGLLVMFAIELGAGIWLLLGAISYAVGTNAMLTDVEEDIYTQQDQMLGNIERQSDPRQQRVVKLGRDVTEYRAEQEKGAVSQGPTRVKEILPEREIPALSQEQAKVPPAQARQRDYGDLLDDDEDERVV